MALMDYGVPMLTDDEVVAVAARLAHPWKTPLPTVALEDEERALAALVRGARSLYVRGLLDVEDGALDGNLADQLDALCSKPLRIGVYAADRTGEPLPGTPTQYFFAGPDDDMWVCDAVSAGGVHTFGVEPAEQVLAAAVRAIEGVLESGVQGRDPDQAVLAVIAEGSSDARQVHVVKGAIRATVVTRQGSMEADLADCSAAGALHWLWAG